jgi:hypothetical protein
MKRDGGRCASNITTCKESLMKRIKAIELLGVTTKARDKKVSMGNRELEPKLKRGWKVGESQGNRLKKGPKSLVVPGKMPGTQKLSRSQRCRGHVFFLVRHVDGKENFRTAQGKTRATGKVEALEGVRGEPGASFIFCSLSPEEGVVARRAKPCWFGKPGMTGV